MKIVSENERFDLIVQMHRQAPPGTEDGVGKWEVDWLIDKTEKQNKELEQTRIARDKALSKMSSFEEMYEDERREVEQLRERINQAIQGLESAKMNYSESQTYQEGAGYLLKDISAVVSLLQGKEPCKTCYGKGKVALTGSAKLFPDRFPDEWIDCPDCVGKD